VSGGGACLVFCLQFVPSPASFPVPAGATAVLRVENIPADATPRELSRTQLVMLLRLQRLTIAAADLVVIVLVRACARIGRLSVSVSVRHCLSLLVSPWLSRHVCGADIFRVYRGFLGVTVSDSPPAATVSFDSVVDAAVAHNGSQGYLIDRGDPASRIAVTFV
jgi:hypothetical protein